MEARDIAVGLGRGRIGIGAVALALPGLATRVMLGRHGSTPGTRAFARMIGGRDVALGLGVVIALDRGAPVRGWLEASALSDAVDLISCAVAADDIPTPALVGSVALAAGAAIAEIWLSRQLDPPPPAAPGHPEAVATGHPAERAGATS